jgi:methyl-accepting chemotaxis protein WspA
MSRDELGQVALEFNRMAQAIEDSQAKELAATNELRAKVDSLLDVVSKAARGDLTGVITIRGEDAIGRLGEGLAAMLGNLRSLLNNVQRAGIQVTTSATQIAASARQQEATGIEQAQTSVEVLATTKEISANTSQLLRTMEEATEVADYTTNATADAQDKLRRMDQTMQQMVNATDSIGAKLAALSEKASNINGVLTTITKVADQTNILSLNAAIEAEKAGEAGRGFAVVATEIRRLADQTSVSTWDIEQMLKEMQSAVSASVMGMDKFAEEIRRSVGEARHVAEQLSGMMDQVRKLAPRFDLVLQGMQSQAVGASQISGTMMQLSDASQQSVDSLKATSEAVHQLQYAAGDLQQSVATFAVNRLGQRDEGAGVSHRARTLCPAPRRGRRVLPVARLKSLPGAPHYVPGLLDLHGEPVPVIDLSRLAGSPPDAVRYDTRILLVDVRRWDAAGAWA